MDEISLMVITYVCHWDADLCFQSQHSPTEINLQDGEVQYHWRRYTFFAVVLSANQTPFKYHGQCGSLSCSLLSLIISSLCACLPQLNGREGKGANYDDSKYKL
jgi:hypothetical protein